MFHEAVRTPSRGSPAYEPLLKALGRKGTLKLRNTPQHLLEFSRQSRLSLESTRGDARFADYGNVPSKVTDNVLLTIGAGVQYRF